MANPRTARSARREAARRLQEAVYLADNSKPVGSGRWSVDATRALDIRVSTQIELARAYLELADVLDQRGEL